MRIELAEEQRKVVAQREGEPLEVVDPQTLHSYILPPREQYKIEYPAGRPDLSRIVGMRRAVLPVWGGFVSLVPLVGVALLVPVMGEAR